MDVFRFDPAVYRDQFVAQGWVHVRNGADEGFLERLRAECRGLARGESRPTEGEPLRGKGIRGAKNQYLYEPSADVDLSGELRRLVTGMCGLDGRGFTVSERHIKWYDADADPEPAAHKDRLASQISIGVSIEVPPGSTLVLYPTTDVGVNPFLTTELRDSLAQDELPEVVLRDTPGVEVEDRPGDVVIFPGSAWWHRRRRSAGTVNLYLKCNDFTCDPLGEDPSTLSRVRQTAEILRGATTAELSALVPVAARQLEWVGTLRGRDGVDRVFAKLWDRAPIQLSESQHALFQALDSRLLVPDDVGAVDRDLILHEDLRSLASRGLIDLISEA